MKDKIKEWLGLPNNTDHELLILRSSLTSLMNHIDAIEAELQLSNNGATPRQRGIKEHVIAILNYLELKPEENYYEKPVESTIVQTHREFKLVPRIKEDNNN